MTKIYLNTHYRFIDKLNSFLNILRTFITLSHFSFIPFPPTQSGLKAIVRTLIFCIAEFILLAKSLMNPSSYILSRFSSQKKSKSRLTIHFDWRGYAWQRTTDYGLAIRTVVCCLLTIVCWLFNLCGRGREYIPCLLHHLELSHSGWRWWLEIGVWSLLGCWQYDCRRRWCRPGGWVRK